MASRYMHNGFKLVKKKGRKQKSQLDTPRNPDFNFEELFNRKIKKAVEDFESSQFCFELIQSIDNCKRTVKPTSISEILCYGLGNFHDSKSSLHQLAALITLKEKLHSPVKLYDPVLSSAEIKYLKDLNFEVLPENEEGKRKINKDVTTLVFFPHCPKQLVNNFLWANWNTNIANCILIGNSLTKIIEDNTQKILQESANYILKIHPKTQEIPLESEYIFENIFNDLSVHYFTSKDLNSSFFKETIEKEPVYLKDLEFITNNTQKI